MARQYRFLILSSIFALSVLILFVGLLGAQPATANVLATAASTGQAPQGDPARGRYLVQIAGCVGCHGAPDLAKGGPIPLAGGREFNLGQLGKVYAPNLTVLQDWTFREFDMALRQGIEPYTKRTLLPVMPYMVFHGLSDSDVASIGAYIKSMTPVEHDIAAAEIGPAGKKLKPLPPVSVPSPKADDSAETGRYLVDSLANCGSCHSPHDASGAVIKGRDYSGGTRNLGTQDNPMYAPAIIGSALTAQGYTKETFAQTLRIGVRPRGAPLALQMPWRLFANMTDTDLAAVWNFLQTKKLDSPWPLQTPPPTRAATLAPTAAPTQQAPGPAATEGK